MRFDPLWVVNRSVRTARRAASFPARLGEAARADPEPTPFEVVYRENKLQLRHYAARGETTQPVPVVFAYAFINSPAVLDLAVDRSVVRQFTEQGFDVYVIDWGDPSRLDTSLTVADYVLRYLQNCVGAASDRAAADAVHLVGISTGSPIVGMYAALFPETVATLTVQGPPLDFHVDGGMLDFRELVSAVTGARRTADGNVSAAAIDLGFSSRKPVESTLGEAVDLWERLDDPEYVDRQARLARWSADGRDLEGGFHRSFVEALVVENRLVENRLELDGRPVDLENVTMPVALVLGAEDRYVPHDASLPFLDVVPSEDTEVFWFPTGHVGSLASPAAHDEGWPRVTEWLVARS